MLQQKGAKPEQLASLVLSIATDKAKRASMATALAGWHQADAAELIAERVIALMEAMHGGRWKRDDATNRLTAAQTPPSRRSEGEPNRRKIAGQPNQREVAV